MKAGSKVGIHVAPDNPKTGPASSLTGCVRVNCGFSVQVIQQQAPNNSHGCLDTVIVPKSHPPLRGETETWHHCTRKSQR